MLKAPKASRLSKKKGSGNGFKVVGCGSVASPNESCFFPAAVIQPLTGASKF